jgi:hypothetical protein
MAGMLADGTLFSSAAMVGADGTLPVYAPLYGSEGLLSGTVAFESATSVGELDGTLNWAKPVTSSRGVFPAAFATTVTVAGSSYERAERVPGGTGMLDFAGGNTGLGVSEGFVLNAAHLPVMSPPDFDLVKFGLNVSTGVFGGTFRDGAAITAYHGVILQQQGGGAGEFLDSAGGGTVELTPSP